MAQALRQASELQCVCDATLALYQPSGGEWNYRFKVNVHEGRINHPELPLPVTGLRGVLVGDPGGITVETAHASLGNAVVRARGRIGGYRFPCDVSLDVSTRGLLLDPTLAASLPVSIQAAWDKLQPLGRVDVDAQLIHEEGMWNTNATLICKGVDVRYERFPYPVKNIVGRVVVRDGIATAETLNGRIGDNRMQCAFRMPIQGGRDPGKIVRDRDRRTDPDRQDTARRAFATRKSRDTAGAIRPIARPAPRLGPVGDRHAVHRRAGSKDPQDRLACHRRTHEVRKVRLSAVQRRRENPSPKDDRVKLIGFRATSANAGTITCEGTYRIASPVNNDAAAAQMATAQMPPARGSRLLLNFQAENVPMDDALRGSLPESARVTWDELSPSGVLDELNVTLGQDGAGTPLMLDVTARQRDRDLVTNRSLSLRPSSLPYRLDVTGGEVHYDGSKVTIHSLYGRHDASTLAASGMCVRDDSGRWQLSMNIHSGSRLNPRRRTRGRAADPDA